MTISIPWAVGRQPLWLLAATLLTVVACGPAPTAGPTAPEAAGTASVPLATPAGILFATDHTAPGQGASDPASLRLLSGTGAPLYVHDDSPDARSAAAQFQPFAAPADAIATGAWSLLEAAGEPSQWAYRAQALFLWQPDRPDSGTAMPPLPAGWSEARYRPGADLDPPPAIEIRSNPRASGAVLTDREGRTLYFYPGGVEAAERGCVAACSRAWSPVRAAALARPTGRFRPVDRQDGLRQWEYDGAALFTSVRDVAPQDTNGISESASGWRVAVIEPYYLPEEIEIRTVFPFGAVLTTSDGLPLYTRNRMEGNLQTSVNIRGAFRQKYEIGKAIGTGGCDADCLKSWRPVEAPDDARASGFWEVATRPDGRQQWVYKGYALYTYANDRPGLITGNNHYDPDEGDQGRYKASDLPPAIRSERTGAYYWHVAEADL